MRQDWEHLLFLHWRWDAAEIQRMLPAGLTVDTHDETAWIGLVPFYMSRIRPVGFPSVPWISNFLEMNLRTYVYDDRGRPGVWFFSLECNRAPAVWLARTCFHLNYQHAKMSANVQGESVEYSWRRRGHEDTSVFRYAPAGVPRASPPGSLEFFLAERYRLFSHRRRDGRILTGSVHHTPYPLGATRVELWDARVFALNGLTPPVREPDHAAYARGVQVEIFPLENGG